MLSCAILAMAFMRAMEAIFSRRIWPGDLRAGVALPGCLGLSWLHRFVMGLSFTCIEFIEPVGQCLERGLHGDMVSWVRAEEWLIFPSAAKAARRAA
jgi:hypothetical protein